jgi:glycosyltransferase involved in cell wall biosynthesis
VISTTDRFFLQRIVSAMMNGENFFVFVAPMFNASDTLPKMLHSIFGQSYDNWRLILIDDVSDPTHVANAKDLIKRFDNIKANHITTIWNAEKKWEVANVLQGMKYCNDNEIVCRIDADDWLSDTDALMMINAEYNERNCEALWTAHRWGFSDKNISGPLPHGADPYRYPWVSSHLKTFRKYLLNGVNDENFRGIDGEYVKRAGDQCIYLPALHNSKRNIFLPRVMYHYTIKDVPETYQTDDARFQRDEAIFLRNRGYVK